MSLIKPATEAEQRKLKETLDMAVKAQGFRPNNVRLMARRPYSLVAYQFLYSASMGIPNSVSAWGVIKHVFRLAYYGLKEKRRTDRVPSQTLFLVAHTSNLAYGCEYSSNHTGLATLNQGVSAEKLKAVHDYKTSALFSDAEKAAIAFGFASGASPAELDQQVIDDLNAHYNEEQILDLLFATSIYGYLGRFNSLVKPKIESAAS